MRYATAEAWAKYFQETEGVQIIYMTIRCRLKAAGIIGITGRNKIGRTLRNGFYSEKDVRETCMDLLMAIEEIRRKAKEILGLHGIHDRRSLIKFGSNKFAKADFHPFGKGQAFASRILHEIVECPTINHFNRISDTLGLPQLSNHNKQKFCAALASQGIIDRKSLIEFGIREFKKTDFPPFGKGSAFASSVLGETVKDLSLKHLHRIADALGFPSLSEQEKKQQYIQALADKDIDDRNSLIRFGLSKFLKTDFPPFGKGYAFISAILSQIIRQPLLNHLHRIADVLGFPKYSEEEVKQQYIQALTEHGIHSRQLLIQFGVVKFYRTEFPPFGKGMAFASAVLGETVKAPLKLDHLHRIADALGFLEYSEEEVKQQYIQTLVKQGINDSQSLIQFGVVRSCRTDFPPFGKGHAFASIVLGESIHPLKLIHLHRIADVLFGEKGSEKDSKTPFGEEK